MLCRISNQNRGAKIEQFENNLLLIHGDTISCPVKVSQYSDSFSLFTPTIIMYFLLCCFHLFISYDVTTCLFSPRQQRLSFTYSIFCSVYAMHVARKPVVSILVISK